ncbi:MAG: phosphotransferase [Candidatus Heimdallarchaeota archaeon]|nr:phosphotransferase [Candidatus Heimdallarchaeota archaeon]MCK5297961.1 phosphotransferase [Candidatus Heimdallarchaeota archaeon]
MKPLLPVKDIQSRLKSYLFDTGKIWTLIPQNAKLLSIETPEQIQTGMSNKVYFLDILFEAMDREIRKSVVLRIYPEKHDPLKPQREFRKLGRLQDAPIPVPKPYVLEVNPKILGYPFSIIERIPGETLEKAIKRYSPNDFERFISSFAQYLVNLHNFRFKNFGVETPKGIIKEEIPYDKFILNDITRSLNFLRKAGYYVEPLSKWFISFKKQLKLERFSLLHGDPQPRNIMVHGAKITGLIDWEYSRLGDPALDAGWTLFFFSLYPELNNYRHQFYNDYITKVKLPEISNRIFFYEVYAASRMMAFAVSARDYSTEKFKESGVFLSKIQEAFFKYEERVRNIIG